MKVAINTCFGGFGLSDKAFELLLTKKGIQFEKHYSGSSLIGFQYYRAGFLLSNDHYLSEYEFFENRADPDLIQVIEEMGKEADSWAADIAVVEIPDDVQWHIDEYDGLEHVAENHRTWYGND